MNDEEIKQIEDNINNPVVRSRISTFNDNTLKVLGLIKDGIKSDMAQSDIKKILRMLASDEPELAADLENAASKYERNKKLDGLSEETKKSKQVLMGKVVRRELIEGVKFLYANHASPDKLQSFLRAKSEDEKNLLMGMVVKDYHNTNYDDGTFKKMNNVLSAFNRRISRRVLGKFGDKNGVTLSPEENQMIRCVMNGSFYLPEDESTYSPIWQKCRFRKAKNNYLSAKDYDLLNKNPLFREASSSQNIRLLENIMAEALSKKGVSVEEAAQLNFSDMAEVLQQNSKDGKISFAALQPLCSENPRQGFCRKLLSDEETLKAIRKDFLANGVSPEYFAFWAENVLVSGNPNPKVEEGRFEGIIPNITIHHKNHVNYAKNCKDMLDINDASNFSMVVAFGNKDPHAVEHLGDNDKVMYVNQNKTSRKDPSLLAKTAPETDDIAVSEMFSYVTEEGRDTRAYISPTQTLNRPDISGNQDMARKNIQTKQKYKISSNYIASQMGVARI